MSDPIFGISITRIDEEPRPAVASDMSVVGLVGFAPDADAAKFPLNTPVLIFSDDTAALTALGAAGTLQRAVRQVNDQLGEFQVAAKVVIVRVEAAEPTGEQTQLEVDLAALLGSSANKTGIYALLEAGPILGVTPRLIAVPGYTWQQEDAQTANVICAALPSILDQLLGVAVVQGPGTSLQAYTDWRETLNSIRLIPLEGGVKVGNPAVVVDGAASILGVGVRRDHEKQGRPFHSWANQPVRGIVGPQRPIRFSLTDGATEAQQILALNGGVILRGEAGMETAIASGGFVYVGTDNAGEDELWRFYNVVRGRDYIHLLFLRTLRFYLGRFNIKAQTIEAILNSMKSALDQLQADGDILGYEVKFTRDQNTPEELRLGKFTVNFAAEEAPVLRYLGIQSARYRPALDALLDQLLTQFDNSVANAA